MKKIILIIYIALFYVSLQVGYAQGVLSPQNLEDEFITVSEPMLGFPLDTRNDEIPDLKFGFRTNFDVAILNEVAIRAAARRNLRNWYDKQTGIIERILETKYGTSFPSFNAAKDHAFLEYERPSIRTYAAPIVSSNVRSRDQRSTRRKTHIRGLKALKVRESEIRKGNINNPLYPNIEVNNIPLKNIRSIAAFNSEYNKLLNEFTENKWREFENNHIAKILGTPFNEEVIKIRNQRYNGLNYWDRLDFMQFLIHFEEFKRLSTPPYILRGEAARIFNKYISKTNIVTTSTMVNNYVNANKASELSLFHPNYWKVILKRDYGNSPFRIDDAIRKQEQLKAAEIRVLINSISINATTTIDYLVNKLKITDEYQIQFLNDNSELGTLFNNQIDAAIREDRNRPPGIPGQLSFPPDFSYQGAVSNIRNELIKGAKIAKLIADVGITDVNQKKWLYENETKLNELIKFGEQNNYSNEAQIFIKKAIDTIKNGFGVDFDDKIINELTGKAKCIYDKLTESSTNFKEMIQKFDSEFSVSHLKLGINNSLTTNNYGITSTPESFSTTIEFSNTQLSTISDLGSAVAFVHELIHAEIYRKMLSAAQKGDLDPNNMTRQEQINYVNSLKNNFPGIYDYYIERWRPTWNHNLMAQHYISVIADAIEQFDKSSLPRQVYEDISWAGLRIIENPQTNGTEISIAWNNLNSSEKSRITSNLNTYFTNGKQDCN